MSAPIPSNTITISLADISSALNVCKRSVERRADKEGWNYSEQSVRGGKKRLYPISTLPRAIREAVQRHQINSVVGAVSPAPVQAVTVAAPGVTRAGGLIRRAKEESDIDDKDRARRDASLVICRAINAAIAATDCSVKRAITELSTKIMDGTAFPELVEAATITYTKPRAGGQTLPALISRLQKMYAAYKAGELAGDSGMYLIPGKSEKRGHAPVDVHAFLIHFCRPSQPPVMEAWKASESWYASHGLTRPSVDTWYRIQKELPVTIKYRGRMTGSAYRALLPYVSRDVSMFGANDIWVGDGHTFKAKIQHPIHGQPFQPEVTVIIDWVSRKIVGWSVDLAESTIAVSAAFRHAQQLTRARCLIYYSDNGSGQTGKLIDSPIHGTLARQGIAHETGIPGNPQGRGIIERLWQTTTIPLARTYPTTTWNGADKEATRKMLVALNKKDGSGERLLPSFGQFLIDLEEEFNKYNATHEHRELGGLTPDQAYQAKLDPDSIDMGITDQELSAQWMPEVARKPQRGIISLFGNEYANKDLVHLVAEGEKVRVRFDIHNADKIWLYRMDGRYIGEAIWDAHKRAAFPVAYIEQKREERAEGKIKRAQRDIAEARAELGNTIEADNLTQFRFEPVQQEPELVEVRPAPIKEKEEETSYMDTVAMLRRNYEEQSHNSEGVASR